VHLAALDQIVNDLLPAMELLASSLEAKAQEFDDVEVGRTHWMDAVPVTLGQEFGSAAQVRQGIARVRDTPAAGADPLGGTATGTGLNTLRSSRRGFGSGSRDTGLGSRRPPIRSRRRPRAWDRRGVGCAQDRGRLVTKVANDIRYLGSGPAPASPDCAAGAQKEARSCPAR
jgi:fumarate hydratase class II